jgi:hypothetical protein
MLALDIPHTQFYSDAKTTQMGPRTGIHFIHDTSTRVPLLSVPMSPESKLVKVLHAP